MADRVQDRPERSESEFPGPELAEAVPRSVCEELADLHLLCTVEEIAKRLGHEINQPLATITTLSDASRLQLRRGVGMPPTLDDALGKITEQAQRAGQTIREMRSRLPRAQGRPVRDEVNRLVRMACSVATQSIFPLGFDVALSLSRDLPAAMLDGLHVQYILLNLLRNSCAAMRDAGLSKGTIGVQTGAQGSQLVLVTVRDAGPGLPADLLERIFEPFFSTRPGGLGMGLGICRTLIEGGGGRIWAEASPGGVVHFTLPVAA